MKASEVLKFTFYKIPGGPYTVEVPVGSELIPLTAEELAVYRQDPNDARIYDYYVNGFHGALVRIPALDGHTKDRVWLFGSQWTD